MEVSKDGSPLFICVICVIRGLFTVYFGLHTACRNSSALSRLQIRIDWPQTPQMQGVAAKTGSVDPLSRCDAADGAFAANPAGRGPGGRGLWRSSSMYVPIHFPPLFAPTTPWPSVNPNL